MKELLRKLSADLDGELYDDEAMRILYATDASAYREMPLAVAIPKTTSDIRTLIQFAREQQTSLIPRTAGTSLAGQVVGNGIVVDVSKHFNQILELNKEEGWVRVQPGVIRDELNYFLKPHGFFFGPETSTANRAMIGGMVGNNSCGSNSVVYRSTREHLLEVKAILSDGSDAGFGQMSIDEFHERCEGTSLESEIYRLTRQLLSNYDTQEEIRRQFPKKTVERRNTGYAVDLLIDMAPFQAGGPDFNFCSLIAGSEGTLAFMTEIKLSLSPLPPKETGLLCVHFTSIDEALHANLIAVKHPISASELIDHYILDCTKQNIEQQKNRFFVEGDPGAILVIEFAAPTLDEVRAAAQRCEDEMRAASLGYHFPLLTGADTKKIWTLRKAGLGLLSNLPGDDKAVPVIEDTAVDVNDLPAYIREFNEILKKHGLYSVHYAHAGSGELHLRPILNLKTEEGNRQFRVIAEEIATLVKKYDGSLSGEHGDGRLRGEFIPQMIGSENYALLKKIKRAWDPQNIFNPGKIVDTPSMNSMLRYEPGQQTPAFKTYFRFPQQDILQHAEQCNGSGDCRKTHLSGGTMCPSYMATRNEKETTRARANILREFLTRSTQPNRFNHKEIYEVMDLCLSCKGCKSECPSNVDVAKLKAEFLQQYYDANGVPFRSKLVANFTRSAAMGSIWPGLYNRVVNHRVFGSAIRKVAGFAPDRTLPLLHTTTLKKWFKKWRAKQKPSAGRKVYLFCDEFTNYNDTEIGMKSVQLLHRLGYDVVIPEHGESGRASLSKGLLKRGKVFAENNVRLLSPVISEESPLLGIEPSAILCFRDEYPDLVDESLLPQAKALATNCLMIDEFLAREAQAGRINAEQFTKDKKTIWLHGHCQQKSIIGTDPTRALLSLPENFEVKIIPSGCCGMAGSFGYEKEHYELSMKVGELVLLPAVRAAGNKDWVVAPGTSCRHQIKDGTGKTALHPVEAMWDALA